MCAYILHMYIHTITHVERERERERQREPEIGFKLELRSKQKALTYWVAGFQHPKVVHHQSRVNGSICWLNNMLELGWGVGKSWHPETSGSCGGVLSCSVMFFGVLINQNGSTWKNGNKPVLVGGFEHGFYFPFYIWNVIRNPLTNSYVIFFKMIKTY